MNDQLAKFKSVVEDLIKSLDDTDTVEKSEESDKVEMTVEEFLTYATKQVEAAKTDEEEIRAARLDSLFKNVEIAKEFIGSPKTPGGVLSVVMFKDPAQQKTELKEQNPKNAPAGQDSMSSNGVQPAVNGAGSTSGDKMPPLLAPGSGFESPTNAAFAKVVDDVIEAVSDIDEDKIEDKVEKTEESVSSVTPKKKVIDEIPFWPLDMNSPFGRGEVEDISVPQWGFDHGKSSVDSE
jgi:hypothetical protein